ncbi:MAG: AAA family ATPase [Actinomycetota bacterium]
MQKLHKTNNNKFSLNVIIADKKLETFNKLSGFSEEINLVNLSSSFAVNFVMEYEKIDVIVISKNIENLDLIKTQSERYGIKVYVIGNELTNPINLKEFEKVLSKEVKAKKNKLKNKKFKVSDIFNLITFKGKSESSVKGEKKLKRKKRIESEKNGKKSNRKESITFKTIRQKIIVLAKAKGGVGSTVLAIYIGNILKKLKILLIDLNFSNGGGDISYYLNLPKVPNIVNFISNYNLKAFKDSVISFKSNLDIIQAPPTIDLSANVELRDIYALVDIAKKKYDLIVFDLPNNFNDLTAGVIDLADILIMISDGTVGSLSRLAKIDSQFSYNDLNKVLVLNKQRDRKLFNKNADFINMLSPKQVISIKELDQLKNRSDFSKLNFSSFEGLDEFKQKIINLLTSAGGDF